MRFVISMYLLGTWGSCRYLITYGLMQCSGTVGTVKTSRTASSCIMGTHKMP